METVISKIKGQGSLFNDDPEGDRTVIPPTRSAEIAAALAAELMPKRAATPIPLPTIEHLLLVDGRAVLDSCWHAAGQVVNETIGAYCAIVMLAIERESPSHVCIAFDHPNGVQLRRSKMPGYKGNREEKTESHLRAIELAKEATALLGFRVICSPAGEADDVLATIAVRVPTGNKVTILSQDKDLLALCLEEHIGLLWRRKGEWFSWRGPEAARERLGVSCHQVADFLAMVGDSADNIPGADGVGEKTAAALLDRYGSLEGIESAMARGSLDIKNGGRISERLLASWPNVKMARWAVALATDLEGEGIPQSAWDVDAICRWNHGRAALLGLERFANTHRIKYLESLVGFRRLTERDQSAPPRF